MKSRNLFFSILKSSFWDNEFLLDTCCFTRDDVMAALRLVKAQTVLGLIVNEIMKTESLSCLLTEGDKAELKRFVMSNLATSQMLNSILVRIVNELGGMVLIRCS